MPLKKTLSLFPILLGVLAISANADASGNPEAGKAKSTVCAACHGPDGNSVNPEWPKLAGQEQSYILKQLRDFQSGKRVNELMSPMAKPLTAQDMENLAAYFSSQKVQTSGADAAAPDIGQKLYHDGSMRPVIKACIGCHGPQGAGNVTWESVANASPVVHAPAIGSQQTAYLIKQLKAFKGGTRTNDVDGIMRGIASNLDDKEIDALAQYVTTLKR
jgi:cytochrome c553